MERFFLPLQRKPIELFNALLDCLDFITTNRYSVVITMLNINLNNTRILKRHNKKAFQLPLGLTKSLKFRA